MERLAPQLRFGRPSEYPKGIHAIDSHHTPRPKREVPLPGTKRMRCEKDDHLKELIASVPPLECEPNSTGKIIGAFAFVLSLLLVASYWSYRFPNSIWDSPSMGAMIVLCAILMHLLAIFSQITSADRNLPGALAIPVLYVGMILNLIIDHFID
jgi:hypothetical protein